MRQTYGAAGATAYAQYAWELHLAGADSTDVRSALYTAKELAPPGSAVAKQIENMWSQI